MWLRICKTGVGWFHAMVDSVVLASKVSHIYRCGTTSEKGIIPPVLTSFYCKETDAIVGGFKSGAIVGIIGKESIIENIDPDHKRRAVAFCARIVDSKKITSSFKTATHVYINSLPEEKKEQMVPIASKHIDGTIRSTA